MSKADVIIPRAPFETWGRTRSRATGARPRRLRIAFTVRAMSGAVSASVPSRSKSTASTTARAQQVVHVHVATQRVHLRERVVGHARAIEDRKVLVAAVARELGGADEPRVLVRSLRQQSQHVLGAHDRERERLRIAVDGGEEDEPAWFHE